MTRRLRKSLAALSAWWISKGRPLAAFCAALALVWLGAWVAVRYHLVLAFVALWFWTPTEAWAKRVWTAVNQLVNAVYFRGGARETISLHAGKLLILEDNGGAQAPKWAGWVDRLTHIIEANHTRNEWRKNQ